MIRRWKWRPRRRRADRGFSLVEVIVALTVTAFTLMLLSGAGYSLRLISERSATAEDAGAVLALRRVLQGWASATLLLQSAGGATFSGTADEVRMVLAPEPATGMPGQLAVLSVIREGGAYAVVGSRVIGGRSVWLPIEQGAADRSVLYRSNLRPSFRFLVTQPEGTGRVWTASRAPGVPPHALALDLAAGQTITAEFPAEVAAGCLALRGIGPFQRRQCTVR